MLAFWHCVEVDGVADISGEHTAAIFIVAPCILETIYYTPTNALLYFNSLKSCTKTFKTLLHVSILRSSSESTCCSLLKLYVKKMNTYYMFR